MQNVPPPCLPAHSVYVTNSIRDQLSYRQCPGFFLGEACGTGFGCLQSTFGNRCENQYDTHVGDPAAVAVDRLGLEGGLLHAPPQGLVVVLGVQNQLTGVVCGTLEEGHVRVQPPARTHKQCSTHSVTNAKY